MLVRVRHVTIAVGLLAVACQLALFLALWAGLGSGTFVEESDQRLLWAMRLWKAGFLAALIAVVLGLATDRRGPSIPMGLLALLVALFPTGFLLSVLLASLE